MLRQAMISAALAMVAVLSFAEDAQYQEGVHYQVLTNPLPTSFRGEEVGEIMEFFSYACIHCYNFEPAVERFKSTLPENIRFTPVPVMFNPRQEAEVKAFYISQMLGINDVVHMPIFNEIHNKRRAMRSDKSFAEFFANYGVEESKYLSYAQSFGINSKVNFSINLTRNSQIPGTPAIIVNGKYRIISEAVGGNEASLQVAQWLVERDAQ